MLKIHTIELETEAQATHTRAQAGACTHTHTHTHTFRMTSGTIQVTLFRQLSSDCKYASWTGLWRDSCSRASSTVNHLRLRPDKIK